jgi:hypothetical protein
MVYLIAIAMLVASSIVVIGYVGRGAREDRNAPPRVPRVNPKFSSRTNH